MIKLTTLLVGGHFRPPAKQLLAHLPAGAALRIEPEFENPYDENALRVTVAPAEVPESQHQALEVELPACGHDWAELIDAGQPVQLGYVAKSGGKPLAKLDNWPGNLEFRQTLAGRELTDGTHWEAKLGFTPEGQPTVSVQG